MKNTCAFAKPDMLTYDSYYFDELGNNKDYRVAAVIADDINRIRIPAMKGYDAAVPHRSRLGNTCSAINQAKTPLMSAGMRSPNRRKSSLQTLRSRWAENG